ncbi:MAG: alkyl hydroperoxide reductase subunit F [Candidatus Paceibacteria bacterium]|jgi:alkyl hydroperoxide reductase subunit F
MYDLIIIGGGPAGTAAGVYASRKQLKTLFITSEWGGQSTVSPDIQNWIGSANISGTQLAKDLEGHLRTYADGWVTIRDKTYVTNIEKTDAGHRVHFGEEFAEATAILIATGSKRRRLDVPGADELEHKGLTYCASCDGPIFAGQDVVVVGGGNAAFETAAQLLAYTKSVTLLNRSDSYKADPVTVEKVLAHPNMHGITGATPTKVNGEKFVSGLVYKKDDVEVELPVTGIFLEIGMIPNTDYVGGAVVLDAYSRVEIDPWTQKTTTEGIWAAGDCTNIKYHQNNISAGDAVKALEDIYVTLKAK